MSAYSSGSLTVGQIFTYYATTKGMNVSQLQLVINSTGIPTEDVASLASHYFNTATSTNLFTSINNGYSTIATVINSDGSGHEVMLTDYNNNGTCEYFAPQLRNYDNSKVPSQFYNAEVHSKR